MFILKMRRCAYCIVGIRDSLYYVTDNKMTIQSPENPDTRYNPDKTPGILPPKSIHYTTEQLCKEEFE